MRLIVQHHPSRAELLTRLLDALGRPAEVVADPQPTAKLKSPWRTYRACLEQLGLDGGIILQDDAVPCPGFLDAARAAVDARPGRLISFFHGGVQNVVVMMQQASLKGQPFIEHYAHGWVPTVALYWPPELAMEFLSWIDRKPRGLPRYWRADDGIVAQWARASRRGALLTVPCLVEHPDDQPSLIGARHRDGKNRARVAALYVGDGAESWVQALQTTPGRL